MGGLEYELSDLLNRHSLDAETDTADYILAQYLLGCLEAFKQATRLRENDS